jgi:NADPH:quinone reductase-like Zn-dependent oxidoreductase
MSTEQQKRLVLHHPQGPLVIEESPIPVPGPGELLIKTESAALNPADWKVRDNGIEGVTYPIVMGWDGAGVVQKVGPGVKQFKEGDRM